MAEESHFQKKCVCQIFISCSMTRQIFFEHFPNVLDVPFFRQKTQGSFLKTASVGASFIVQSMGLVFRHETLDVHKANISWS